MSIEQTDISPMDLLGKRLREQFPEITGGSVSARHDFFTVEIVQGTANAPFTKALDTFLKDYLSRFGDPEQEYQFTLQKGRQLVNILRYNDPEHGYHVEVLAEGKLHRLFVVDVMGATGDFSVYNEDFELLGAMNMKKVFERTDPDYGDDRPHPNFSDSGAWEATGELVQTYLNQIVGQVSLQIDAEYRKGLVDIEDEGDLVYYPSVFNVSVEQLKDGVREVGPTIGALEDYFQREKVIG
ncbi:MAG: hypothetical protein EOO90_03495 [Pedobacter sp.]|nr:MAG: hypothetical protein EOO90_03495 [Pedobacter sp.]